MGKTESGSTIGDAFPGAVYTVLTRTEHTTSISGVDNVRVLDGYVFQCAYEDLGNLIKSNAVTHSFISPSKSQNTCNIGRALTIGLVIYANNVAHCGPGPSNLQ